MKLCTLSRMSFFILCLCAFSAQAQSLTPIVNRDWVTTSGTPNGIYDFQASHVISPSNAVVVVGNTFHYGQSENFLISEYGNDGNLIFKREIDGAASKTDFTTDVTTIGNSIYVTGVEGDTVTGSTFITTIKLDSVGRILWTSKYQNSYKKYNLGFRIIPDPAGSAVYVCGTSQTGPVDFAVTVLKYSTTGTQTWVATYDSVGLYDAAIDMKVSGSNLVVYGISGLSSVSGDIITRSYSLTSGTLVSASRINNTGAYVTRPVAIAKDNAENIYLTGISADVGRMDDIVIIKLDSNLNLKWRKYLDGGNSKSDGVSAIKVDSRNNIIMTGWAANADTSKAIWTIKMKDSVIVWQKKRLCAITGQDAKGADADLDSSNNIYVTGKTFNGRNFDNLTLSYDSSGNVRWEQEYTFSAISNDEGRNIKIDSAGSAFVYGRADSSATYRYFTLKYTQDKSPLLPDSGKGAIAYSYYQNRGQIYDDSGHVASGISYYSNFGHPQLYLGTNKLSYVFADVDGDTATIDSIHRIDMIMYGANTTSKPYATETQGTMLNYLQASLPNKSITNIKANKRIVYKNVYNGIDMQLSSDSNGIKYYFIIYPYAEYSQISLKYVGASSTSLSGKALTIHSPIATFVQDTVKGYLIDNHGSRTPVSISYIIQDTNRYGFHPSSYDASQYLVIEVGRPRACSPAALTSFNSSDWSTYLGGNGEDRINDITTTADGNLFACGYTTSNNFPSTTIANVLQNASSTSSNSSGDAFIACFDKLGVPVFCTYYGGISVDEAFKIKAKASPGDLGAATYIYITGTTSSWDMPVSPTSGPGSSVGSPQGVNKGFIAKLTYDGQFLTWARYIGLDNDFVNASSLAIDGSNNVYVTGSMQPENSALNFPVMIKSGAYNQSTSASSDKKAYILEFDQSGTQLWGTFFGEDGGNALTLGTDIAIGNNAVYLVGATSSLIMGNYTSPCTSPTNNSSFPTCNPGSGAYFQSSSGLVSSLENQAFISEFNNSGQLVWSTLFGASWPILNTTNNSSSVPNISINPNSTNEVAIIGEIVPDGNTNTMINTFTSSEYGQPNTCPSGNCGNKIFAAKFKSRVLNWSTSIGANGSGGLDLVYDNANNLYMVGTIEISSAAYTPSAYQCLPPNNPVTETPDCQDANTFFQTGSGGGLSESILFATSGANSMIWGSFYGGDAKETIICNAADNTNHYIYIGGRTQSNCSFPLINPNTGNYMQNSIPITSNQIDAFIGRFKIQFSNITGVQSLPKNDTKFLISYPDPSHDELNIICNFSNDQQYSIEVTSMSGQTVKVPYIQTTTEIKLNVSSLPSDVYFVKILDDHIEGIAKFIKID